jgi:hypothetical protein
MTLPNYERNQVLEQYWRDGKTVDDAALLSGIPRSTVGYYYRKFNRYAKMGVEPSIPAPRPQSPTDAYVSVFLKAKTLSDFVSSLRNEDPQTFYYRLASFKLLLEVFRYFHLTPEEKKQLDQLIQTWIAANIASQGKRPA